VKTKFGKQVERVAIPTLCGTGQRLPQLLVMAMEQRRPGLRQSIGEDNENGCSYLDLPQEGNKI
jgi:hypothetical protein